MLNEVWRDVVGYEGFYQVSNLGRVKSLARLVHTKSRNPYTRKEKLLKPSFNGKGYLQVRFFLDGEFPSFKVHRLVAESFLKDFDSKKQVNHINGNKSDNRVSNLELVDQMENMEHRAKFINKKPRGVRKHNNRWKAQTTFCGKPHSFGYFLTQQEAYAAFYEGFKKLRGVEPWDLRIYKTH